LVLRGVHGEASGDPVREIAGCCVAKLVAERPLATGVFGDGHNGEEVRAESLAGHGRAIDGAVAIGLVEIAHPSHQIRLGVSDEALDRETALAASNDVRATVRQRRLGDDLRLGPNVVRFRAGAHLVAAPDEDDAERPLMLDARRMSRRYRGSKMCSGMSAREKGPTRGGRAG